jgi:cyclase
MQAVSRRGALLAGGGAFAAMVTPGALAALVGRIETAGTYFPWAELAGEVHATIDLSMGGNAMVIASEGEAVLVDTKFPAFAAALAREGATFGGPVTRVINTHHHGDHTGGNGVLNAQAEIIAHAKAAERIADSLDRYLGMAKGGPRQVNMTRHGAEAVLEEAQAAAEASVSWDATAVVPDITIDQWPHEMKVGEVRIVLYHFGAGHTDNDLVVHLPDLNILHTGDLCFSGLHPFFDPDGGATCRGWSHAVAKTIELCDAETVVVPGHGELTDREGLKTQKRYLDEVWDRVAKQVRLGKTKEDVSAMSWDFMDGLGFEQVRSRALGAVYDEVSR